MRMIKNFYRWNGHTESTKLYFFHKVAIFSFLSGVSTSVNERAITCRITKSSLILLGFLLKHIHICCLELISLQKYLCCVPHGLISTRNTAKSLLKGDHRKIWKMFNTSKICLETQYHLTFIL